MRASPRPGGTRKARHRSRGWRPRRPPGTAEGDGPLQGGDHRFPPVDGLQLGELVQVPGEAGHPLGRRSLDEGIGHRTEGTEGLLGSDSWAGPSACGSGSRPAVVVVVDGGLTRGNDQMLGDDLAQEHHCDHAVPDPELDVCRRCGRSAPSSGPSRTGHSSAGPPCG